MPPASAAQGISPNPDRGMGLCWLLGTDYERKKNKLKQELQLDYQHYAATKRDLKTREPHPQAQGLSLPIDEKILIQDKLREERKKEYNLFLQEKAQMRRIKRGTPPVTSKPGQVQASDAAHSSSLSPLPILNALTNTHPPPTERPASRRDAATLTEAGDNGIRKRTWGPVHRGRRRWFKEPYSSEEELLTDREEELDFRRRWRHERHTPEPMYKERRARQHRANSTPSDIKEVEAPGGHHQNNSEWFGNSDPPIPDSMRTAARSRPATGKDKAEFTTGLIIGTTEEQTVSQLRKEQYKQELLKQIAEQQRNKIREKKLELRVAATGATDPEKEPDRIKQFGAVNRQHDSWSQDVPYKPGIDLKNGGKVPNPRSEDDKHTEDTEKRAAPRKSHMDSSTALSELSGKTVSASGTGGVPLLDYFSENYHRDLSNTLGELAIPRDAGVPPPVPPTVTNNYKTPYDAAYYYYGTRNPLDNLPYNQNGLPEGVQQSGNILSASQRPPPLRPSGRTEATDQHRSSPRDVRKAPTDKAKQRRESSLSYQEALREQIKEREERKRREKEEKERYDAKIEAEMMAYNPWGKSGGGAPIKDQKGNLVSDLNQMHRINQESYHNPASGNSEHTQTFLMRNGHGLGAEARATPSHRLSGFNNQLTPQQLHVQDRYKEELKQQIEENKRKQEEERERMRTEEEKEEKRLADQRARMQREYEEEQRQRKKVEHGLETQSWIRANETQPQEEEKKVRQEKEIEKKVRESARGREEIRKQSSYEREPSPPIPTLQRTPKNPVASRPSSVEHTVSAPLHQPVPVIASQPRDGQQEVIRELSALRRHLRKEQTRLEVQLGWTNREESCYAPPSRLRARVDARESAHQHAVPPLIRSPSTAAAPAHIQNTREVNQLKHRDFLDQQLSHNPSRNKPGRHMHRDSILPSETAFIDFHSGDACEEQVHNERRPQPPAEHRERTAPHRRPDDDEAAVSVDQRNSIIHTDDQCLQPVTSLNLESKVGADKQHRITRQNTGDHHSRSEGLLGDETDVLSLCSALERCVSVETVATEPWLRPGTSDAGKHSGCRETPSGRTDAPSWLAHRIT